MTDRAGVVLDLDGTLIDSNNQVIGGIDTVHLLQSLKRLGMRIAIITGRLDHDIVKIDEELGLGIEERISENGAVIYSDNRMYASLLDKQEAHAINCILREYSDVRVELNTVDRRYWQSPRDPEFPGEFYDSSIIVEDYDPIISYQPAVLFLTVGKTERLREIQKRIKENYHKVDAIMTSSSSLEIIPEGVSKGSALHEIFKDESIYAIGDSESDQSMMKYAERFYYVGGNHCTGAAEKPTVTDALEDILNESIASSAR